MKTMVILQPTHPGLLAEITGLLAMEHINLMDISGHVAGRMSVITLQAEPYREVFRLLTEAGYHVYASETLLVRVEQAPGNLARLSQRLADAGVEVRGLHIVDKHEGAGIVALETGDHEKARVLLKDQLVG